MNLLIKICLYEKENVNIKNIIQKPNKLNVIVNLKHQYVQ